MWARAATREYLVPASIFGQHYYVTSFNDHPKNKVCAAFYNYVPETKNKFLRNITWHNFESKTIDILITVLDVSNKNVNSNGVNKIFVYFKVPKVNWPSDFPSDRQLKQKNTFNKSY